MTADDKVFVLYKALEWAMGQIPEKIDTAAGIGCEYCDGVVPVGARKGMIDDPIAHQEICPWLAAKRIIKQVSCGECGATGSVRLQPGEQTLPCPECSA